MSVLGIVSGLASAGAAVYGAIRAKKAAKQQKEHQKELQEHAKQQQLDIWKKTNYRAQKDQIKSAGLNPALLYGMGGTGGATTGSVGAGQAAAEQPYDIGRGIDRAIAAAQIEVAKSQAEKNRAEAEKIKGVDTQESESRISKLIAETSNEKVKNGLLEAETNLKEIEASLSARTFEARFDEMYWNANKAYEEWQQATVKTYVDQETKEAVIDNIGNQAIGSAIQNMLMESNIEVNKTKIYQMAESVQQAWKGLEQGDTKLAIEKFKETVKANYPTLMESIGRATEDTLDALFKLIMKNRPTHRGIK